MAGGRQRCPLTCRRISRRATACCLLHHTANSEKDTPLSSPLVMSLYAPRIFRLPQVKPSFLTSVVISSQSSFSLPSMSISWNQIQASAIPGMERSTSAGIDLIIFRFCRSLLNAFAALRDVCMPKAIDILGAVLAALGAAAPGSCGVVLVLTAGSAVLATLPRRDRAAELLAGVPVAGLSPGGGTGIDAASRTSPSGIPGRTSPAVWAAGSICVASCCSFQLLLFAWFAMSSLREGMHAGVCKVTPRPHVGSEQAAATGSGAAAGTMGR